MNIDKILGLPSMPMASPSYPRGPYRFINREYFNIVYESDPEAIRNALPEPLEPDGSNTVVYEFMRMPDSPGFGSFNESGMVIPAKYKGEPVNFVMQLYLDCEPPISGGREVWGFPKKYANPKLTVVHDTLTGKLEYAEQLVALGTMAYKRENLIAEGPDCEIARNDIIKKLGKTCVNLKIIPNVDGSLGICQLVAFNMCDAQLKEAWRGPARLHLIPNINAPVSDLPVKKVICGLHFVADITLPYGRVMFDYLAK